MKKVLLFATLLLVNSLFLYSQDIIYKTDGSEISSKVIEIGEFDVKFKNFEQNEGPIRSIQKRHIFMIAYQDGTIEKFFLSDSLSTSLTQVSNFIVDADGNKYKTVAIGNQVWMAENLKTTKYNNNTYPYTAEDNEIWFRTYNPCYCWYNNEIKFKDIYGAIYNWPAISIEGLCPAGWHIPDENDLSELISFLGGEKLAGGKMKEQGTTHWNEPNIGASNECGFTALPGGWRTMIAPFGKTFDNEGKYSVWWLSTKKRGLFGCGFMLDTKDASVRSHCSLSKKEGAYVRCIKD